MNKIKIITKKIPYKRKYKGVLTDFTKIRYFADTDDGFNNANGFGFKSIKTLYAAYNFFKNTFNKELSLSILADFINKNPELPEYLNRYIDNEEENPTMEKLLEQISLDNSQLARDINSKNVIWQSCAIYLEIAQHNSFLLQDCESSV